MIRFIQSNKKLELRISGTQNLPETRLLAKNSSKKTLKCVTSMKVSLVASGDIGVFLLTSAVLELVRRFSSAHCPFIWHGLQAAQILCCPPFKWIQKWAPFTGFVRGMKTLSRPLMFLSVVKGFLGKTDTSKGTLSDPGLDLIELSSELVTQDTRHVNEVPRNVDMEDWLVEIYQELEKQGITIPKRLNEDELRRFYVISNGDFAKFVSSVKKTIQWRQEYTMLSPQELKVWDNLVFWHGYDVMQRPSLIVRIGLASTKLDSNGQSQFARAVISKVEYGVVNLVTENPQLTVFMDCGSLLPFKFPIQKFKSCVALLQDNYPDRLGCLLVARVPSIAQVMTKTLSQDLGPGTLPKLTFVDEKDPEFLSRYFKKKPDYSISDEEAVVGMIFLCVIACLVVLIFLPYNKG